MASRFSRLEFDDQDPQAELSAAPVHGAAAPTSQGYINQAVERRRWGQCEEALRLYTRCLKEDRTVIPAWVGQVQMLVELGEYDEARLWSDKALEAFRNNGEILAAKAQACARLKDFRAAYACSDAALHSPGSSAWRWQSRGEVLIAKGERLHVECFEKALSEADATWFDRVIVGAIYMFYGQSGRAVQYLRQAIELEPGHGYNWFMLGQCQAALGCTAAAREAFDHCIQLAPRYQPAREARQNVAQRSWLSNLWRKVRGGGR